MTILLTIWSVSAGVVIAALLPLNLLLGVLDMLLTKVRSILVLGLTWLCSLNRLVTFSKLQCVVSTFGLGLFVTLILLTSLLISSSLLSVIRAW